MNLPARVVNEKTDTAYYGSPQPGDTDCKCSRCRKQINELETPLRVWPNSGDDVEYRYCETCQKAMGFTIVQPNIYPHE